MIPRMAHVKSIPVSSPSDIFELLEVYERGTVITAKGRKVRVANGLDRILAFCRGGRPSFRYVGDDWPHEWGAPTEFTPPRQPPTPAASFASRVRRWAKFVLDHTQHGVWDDLRAAATAVTPERLHSLREMNPRTMREVSHAAASLGLPFVQRLRTASIGRFEPPAELTASVRSAVTMRDPIQVSWMARVRCEVIAQVCDDGSYRALLVASAGPSIVERWAVLDGTNMLLLDGLVFPGPSADATD